MPLPLPEIEEGEEEASQATATATATAAVAVKGIRGPVSQFVLLMYLSNGLSFRGIYAVDPIDGESYLSCLLNVHR
jgi:hypothetical protein